MNWFEEIVRSLSAAGKVLMHDHNGLSEFNNTTSGFWRSFTAVILIAPLYLFIASINWVADAGTPAQSGWNVVDLGNLVLQWALWPLVMVFATRRLGLGQNYSRYIIVYNWSNVLLITLLGVPALLFTIGIIPLPVAALFTGLLQFIIFYLEWYLARLSLDTSGPIAAAIVLANLALSYAIVAIIS